MPNNAEYLEQQRLANAALAEKQQIVCLPEVTTPSLKQKLLREFERIAYESSSDDDDLSPMASDQSEKQGPPGTPPKANQEENGVDLSSDLNALFNPPQHKPKSTGPGTRWKRASPGG
jgi:hypothetical protein